MHVTAVDLATPTIADFDLAVSGRRAITDHEMISETVLHPPKMAVVIIESRGISLPSAAVVYHDVLPAAASHRRAIDLIPNGGG